MDTDRQEQRDALTLAERKGYALRWIKPWNEERRHIAAIDIASGEVIAYASHYSGIIKFFNQQPDLCHARFADDTG